jgi:hypothetical protein
MGIAPDSILGVAVETVTSRIDKFTQLSDYWQGLLAQALTDIGNIQVGAIPAPPSLSVPNIEAELGSVPTLDPPPLDVPDVPAPPDLSAFLTGLDIPDMIDLPDAPMPLPINIPASPAMRAIPAPVRPDIDTQVDIPDAPAIVMPEMEELTQIHLPDFEFPVLPEFDAVPPDASGIVVPNVFINWAEPEYASEILDELQAWVLRSMEGGTGLPPPIEDALFSRARERDSKETGRQVREALDLWAARNFSLPPGALAAQIDAIREAGRLKAAELNRDILIEAAKWEIENIRFAVQQGIALEQLTQNLFENMAKRLFEVARFQAQAQIDVFNAQVSLFNAQNAAFATLASVFKTRLEAALSKLQAYKIAVDAQVALGQINQQRVEVFKAKLAAVSATVEIYKAMMQGASVRADTIKNQFDAFRADVQAYSAEISAEKVKFDAYEAQVKAEASKAGVFDSQARAYASTVSAIASRAEIGVKRAQVRMEAAKTHISKFLADVDVFKARTQAGLSQAQYVTQVFSARVDAWKAQAHLGISQAEATSRVNIAYTEMAVGQYKALVQKAIQEAQLALEAAKALGAYTAQLAAGALSAAHVSASISGSGSANTSDSKSTSTSTSHNYSY